MTVNGYRFPIVVRRAQALAFTVTVIGLSEA